MCVVSIHNDSRRAFSPRLRSGYILLSPPSLRSLDAFVILRSWLFSFFYIYIFSDQNSNLVCCATSRSLSSLSRSSCMKLAASNRRARLFMRTKSNYSLLLATKSLNTSSRSFLSPLPPFHLPSIVGIHRLPPLLHFVI